MNLFYCESLESNTALLNEVESKHCVSVLRKKVNDEINLFDGDGIFAKGTINSIGKKMVQVTIREKTNYEPTSYYLHVAVAPTKNKAKIEWFVEKAVEFGIQEISFFHSKYSERTSLNMDRINKIILTAAKQSKSYYLPKVNAIERYEQVLLRDDLPERKMIATLHPMATSFNPKREDKIICVVGPEGGFKQEEIEFAIKNGFEAVTLGKKRLRTETAALFFTSAYYQIHL